MHFYVCKVCRGRNVKLLSGGETFGKRKEKYVCLDCGFSWEADGEDAVLEALSQQLKEENGALCVHFHAEAKGVQAEHTLEVPFCDGEYDLTAIESGATCRFRSLKIHKHWLYLDGEEISLASLPAETVREFIACDESRVGWTETVKVTVSLKKEKGEKRGI